MAIIKLSTKEVQARVDAVAAWHDNADAWDGTEPKDTFLYDTMLSGFGCKITKAGSASWFVEKRFAGAKGIRKKLGNYPAMSIDVARKQCQIMLGELAKGVDISKDHRATVALQRESMNGKTLAAWYTEYHKTIDNGHRYRREQMQTFNNWIEPVLGQAPIKQVSKQDVKALLAGLEINPQRMVYSLLTPFFRWLCEHDVIEVSPMVMIKRPKQPKPRQRTLTDDEIRGFWHAARRMGPLYSSYYKLLLLLASRKTETKRMRWSDIDFMRREWRIPAEDTKTERAHIVHLSDQALAVLQGIERGESSYVFANGDGLPVSANSEPWHVLLALMDKPTLTCADIRREAKWTYEGVVSQISIEGFTQHDLRRTVSTRMVGELAIAPWVADKIQNHVAESTVRRTHQVVEYLKERREAIEAWGSYVAKLVGATEPAVEDAR
jgi:integrase